MERTYVEGFRLIGSELVKDKKLEGKIVIMPHDTPIGEAVKKIEKKNDIDLIGYCLTKTFAIMPNEHLIDL